MTQTCWICGSPADSGEHLVKRSDLKSLTGVPSQSDPLYLHTTKRRNFRIGSLDAKALKSPVLICQYCNNTRTQPHDYAWQIFSETLRSRQPSIKTGAFIRTNSVFPYNTRHAMRHVHLYLLKLFGCRIIEGDVPIEIAPFAQAILNDRLHPNVYFALVAAPEDAEKFIAGSSDMEIATFKDSGKCAFAVWFHHVGNLWVRVMFALDEEKRQGLEDAWHPRLGSKRLKIAEL